MAFEAKRAEIIAAIAELHRLQTDAIRQATFGGWTHELEEAHDMRCARIAALCRELEILGGKPNPNPTR